MAASEVVRDDESNDSDSSSDSDDNFGPCVVSKEKREAKAQRKTAEKRKERNIDKEEEEHDDDNDNSNKNNDMDEPPLKRQKIVKNSDESNDENMTEMKGEMKEEKKEEKKEELSGMDKVHLANLPKGERYEWSYQHVGNITHIKFANNTDFLITGDNRGIVEFWKKESYSIEFAKKYRAHIGSINDLNIDSNGMYLCTIGSNNDCCIFDISTFDMIVRLQLGFTGRKCCWIEDRSEALPVVAITSTRDENIYLYQPTKAEYCGTSATLAKPFKTLNNIHDCDIVSMIYNKKYQCAMSSDINGNIEFWDINGNRPSNLKFNFLIETDYLKSYCKNEILKNPMCPFKSILPLTINLSPNEELIAIYSNDNRIRIFNFSNGKCIQTFNESLNFYEKEQNNENSIFKEDSFRFGRLVAKERELNKLIENNVYCPNSDVIFDESSRFIIYPSILGIKIVCIENGQLCNLIGKSEGIRFLHLQLFQGMSKNIGDSVSQNLGISLIGSETSSSKSKFGQIDPTIFASAFNSDRFYLFTNRVHKTVEAENRRDKLTEKPKKFASKVATHDHSRILAKNAIIRTTYGDIHIRLCHKECPKTVENFTVHSQNGYYDGCIFHRVIKSFMIQTGDPNGDGTGGQSIWGGTFEDEFHASLSHDRPGTVSMANTNTKNSNGSQFFITTVQAPWLDNKHTIFGRVTKGMDIVQAIESVKTYKSTNKPKEDIKIIHIDVQT